MFYQNIFGRNRIRLGIQICLLFRRCHNEVFKNLILKNTVLTRHHLTPEIQLRLITPDCDLWHSKYTDNLFPNDPFWGIYWPGGQALGRFILDNKDFISGKNVVDIGSGSGACAVAAAMSGANIVLANDTDPMSITAIEMNALLNNVRVFSCSMNLIGENIDEIVCIENVKEWNVILVGDMFYDTVFSNKLFHWLSILVKKGKDVFIGDPGRHGLKNLQKLESIGRMIKVAEYGFDEIEHNGFPTAAVYKVESHLDLSETS